MAQSFRAQIRGLGAASLNCTQANAMLQVAEGAADQIHNMLSQAGIDPPAVGFIEYQVEHGDNVIRRKP